MANQDVADNRSNTATGGTSRIRKYFRETAGELRKVHWPTWPEARSLTTVVLGVMLAMALFLGLFDTAFGWVMNGVIRVQIVNIAILIAIALAVVVLVIFAGKDRR
jgi:preprotein translocase SecE subunit